MKRPIAACAAAIVMTAPVSSAHTGAEATLKLQGYELGRIAWTNDCRVQDQGYGCPAIGGSPLDQSNRWGIYSYLIEPYSAGRAHNGTSGIKGRPVGQVRNLSFDYTTSGDIPPRSPRIEIVFTNGDYAFLAAPYCGNPIAVSDGQWSRADFTGQRAVNGKTCGLWVNFGQSWSFVSATATKSAWKVFAGANPDLVVQQAGWVYGGDDTAGLPGPPGECCDGEIGSVVMDRLAIHDHMWLAPNVVRHCPDETTC